MIWHGPAKAKKPPAGQEGITHIVTYDQWGRARRRKATIDDLRANQALLDRYQAESDAIRARVGLEPVPPNSYRQALAAAIVKAEAEPAKVVKVKAPLTPRGLVDERKRLERELARVNGELASAGKNIGPAALGKLLGVSRQAAWAFIRTA